MQNEYRNFEDGPRERLFWRAVIAFACIGYAGLIVWAVWCAWWLYSTNQLF